MRVVALVLALAVTKAGTTAEARSCMEHDHQPLQVRRMPITPETTSKPRNPLEDEAVHCESTRREGPTGLKVPSTEEAPFGLSWGPVKDVPKPSMVDREANVTALIYLHDRPLAAGADTDRVILEVCEDEGLQQVIWLGRPLSKTELPGRYDAIFREGVRRHGQPRTDDASGDVLWSSGRVFLTMRQSKAGERRLAMVSRGPRYASCSVAHEAATGHSAGSHGASLVGVGRP